MEPKYPHIKVKLVGEDGNALSIIGRVLQALRRNNVPKNEQDAFAKEAMSGDYNNVLGTCFKWVDCF